jgi:hypothetical protein
MAHTCQFANETAHGFVNVMVNYELSLCEVGAGCLKKCPFSYTPTDVKECPTCKGDPLAQPNMTCATCDVFSIVRIK